ncbi:MAG: cytochrome c oxidase subunit II [Gammaproteobacteria bacterium]|nr:cytochrome c oxidase subunit II [Gammaproteobacteria bacterium]|tara:strand:+ start:1454 stop:2062 length:609 start_codon:yes stop_codon:yes gene_type:complete
MRAAKTFLWVFSFFIFASNAVAEDAGYAICVSCHSPDGSGNVALNAPAIAGQETWYMETQLKNFKSGARGVHESDIYGQQMRAMTLMLADDAAIASVSAYVSSMERKKVANTVEGNADNGKALFAVCGGCHGPDAKGLKMMNSPDLTAQQDWYLVRQLQNFRTGVRGTDPSDMFGQQMRPMAMMLADDQAVKDVVAYINTLH